MRHEFKLQDPGEGVHEVEIREILISEGDTVAEGDEVLVVESDKAAIELPTPFSGSVVEIRVRTGDVADVGDVLLVVEDDAGEADGPAPNGDPETGERSDKAPDPDDGARAGVDDEVREIRQRDPRRAAPENASDGAVDKRARKAETDEENVDGDTPRATSDNRAADAEGERSEVSAAGDRTDEDSTEDSGADGDAGKASEGPREQPVPAAPAARKLAEKKGVDLADVEPSGRDGQVKVADVRSALEKDASTERNETRPEMDRDDFGPIERSRLRSIRAATARTMSRAWAEIPHVVHQDQADVTELERWRRKLNNDDSSGQPLTLTTFLIKAAAALLQRYPRFNARLDKDADEIVLCKYYNINVAVATDRGLLTPVLRGADRKSVRVIASELEEISDRVRTGRPSKQDLAGGTFTITNVGGIGGTAFSPIINPPQSAILGFGRARLVSVARGEIEAIEEARTEVRMMLPVILAFDHRLIDGAEAAHFVNDYCEVIESVRNFAVEV